MTREKRQDVIIVALAASLIVHVVLMIVMRPRVMSRLAISSSSEEPKERRLVVTEAEPTAKTVELENVPDVEPPKDAPEAETPVPGADALSAPCTGIAPEAPLPVVPGTDDIPKPSDTFAPYLSEKIHVDTAPRDFTMPIVENAANQVTPPPESRPPTSPLPIPEGEAAPLLTAPAYALRFNDGPLVAPEQPRPAAPVGAQGPSAPFVPVQEVMEAVDEKVVDQEKAAVRDLLNGRDAAELTPVLSVTATSARAGDWLYFRVQFTPRASLEVVPKDVVVLLDASGSIGNDRLKSCRAAAKRILRSCVNTGDRFNLVAFRDRYSYAFRTWQDCTQASFDAADSWLGRLAAFGRTDVFASARSVLTLPRDPRRPLIALIVTDGDANTGVSETADILAQFSALNDGLISVYMYGVKESANRELIDVLTHGNRGESFIHDGSRWSAGNEIDGLGERFRDPVLTDLRVIFASGIAAETYPRLLRNVYRGGTVDFVGRVPASLKDRHLSFSLKGLNGRKVYEGFFDVDLSGVGFDSNLPAVWAREKGIDAKLR